MTASASIEIVGAKEAVRSLNKLEPGLRKQFAAQATSIAQPAISEAQNRYNAVGWGVTHVEGVRRQWAGPAVNGRRVFPFNLSKALSGVKIRLEGDRRKTAVILIEQRDAGTAILESAGRKTNNRLGNALGALKPTTSRVIGPALYSKKEQVSRELEKEMLAVAARVQRELN